MDSPSVSVDPDGLLEFSVVFTDRSLNHMSQAFQSVMKDISGMLREVYNAETAVVVPGGGTYGMEAVARQFATGKRCLVVRNSWFSYRWTQICEAGDIPKELIVIKAKQTGNDTRSPFAPPAIEDVVKRITEEKPEVVFAPHVETSAGIILPDDYIHALAEATHTVGGLFVLDCIASGAIWVDMKASGVDVLISAPQKGWSSTPSSGLVMLSTEATKRMADTQSTSFAVDLAKWHSIMQAYEGGGFGYHATMPTDGLVHFRDAMLETKAIGFDVVKARQQELGDKVRAMLAEKGFRSVAPEGFGAPGVVVSYTDDPDIKSGSKFVAQGVQIAAGVPLQCDEPADFSTFRIGLFGLDKLADVDATVATLRGKFDQVMAG